MRLYLAIAAVWAMAACDAPTGVVGREDRSVAPVPAAAPVGSALFRVYDRNVYLGGDTGPLFTLDFSQLPANIVEVVSAVDGFWQQVLDSKVAERAAALAEEVAASDPHVITLQEVALYAVVDLATGAIVDGSDFLTLFREALTDRGLDYELVDQQAGSAAQLPLALGAAGPTRVLAFAVGEAVLVRGDVAVTAHDKGFFGAFAQLGPVALKRGWIHVEIPFEGVPHHVVTTQLETQGLRPIHDPQAQEFLGLFGDLEGVTILAGDFNSDAEAEDGDPSWTPTYDLLTAHGFVDAWTEKVGRKAVGWTCCWDPDLTSGVLDERIDFVFVRLDEEIPGSGPGQLTGAVHMTILGDDPDERTQPSGLWPADHAGLSAALNLPEGLLRRMR